ncbi:MAG: hypothetical protein ACRDIU_06640 [Actinomycetota bacterium]
MNALRLPEPLLAAARQVGQDLCWPAKEGEAIIRELAKLGLAILGLELWMFDEDDGPRVVGWTDYELDLNAPWDQVVRDAADRAEREILEHVGNKGLWINIQWITREEASPPEAHR